VSICRRSCRPGRTATRVTRRAVLSPRQGLLRHRSRRAFKYPQIARLRRAPLVHRPHPRGRRRAGDRTVTCDATPSPPLRPRSRSLFCPYALWTLSSRFLFFFLPFHSISPSLHLFFRSLSSPPPPHTSCFLCLRRYTLACPSRTDPVTVLAAAPVRRYERTGETGCLRVVSAGLPRHTQSARWPNMSPIHDQPCCLRAPTRASRGRLCRSLRRGGVKSTRPKPESTALGGE